jgi:hypothetical protein
MYRVKPADIVESERKQNAKLQEIWDKVNARSHADLVKMVQRNGCDIGFIANQTEELQLMAIQQNPSALEWIRKPTKSIVIMAKLLS